MNAMQKRPAHFSRPTMSGEAKLCFAASAGCFATGILGGLTHRLVPGGAALTGLITVGAFYLVLGLIALLKVKSTETGRSDQRPHVRESVGQHSERGEETRSRLSTLQRTNRSSKGRSGPVQHVGDEA